MGRLLHIACLQTRPMPDIKSALGEALALATQAVDVGAKLIVLPEYCGDLKTNGSSFAPPVEAEGTHRALLGLQEFAKSNSVWMLVGSIAVPGGKNKYRNRTYMLGDQGEIIARYDKINLFDVSLYDESSGEGTTYRESDTVEAGDQLAIVDLPFTSIGLSICYDLRFPNLYRQLAQAGAEILMIPAAFTAQTGRLHWHVLNRARAIENSAFVVAPCAVGPFTGGGQTFGHSLIVDPVGNVLTDGGDKPGMTHFKIDLDEVKRARERIPSWKKDAQCKLVKINKQVVA